ncbi:MAG: 23S rRNA (uracil(1939)-C(5))-methyltransferase RlmD [bacterium]|nr:23S rRNA (uracil(1939)-C(5))-methyltransferase RlmD [bacterium]
MKIEAGNEYELTIESVSSDGNGIGHIGSMAVFVPFTAAGDRVRVRVTTVRKSYAAAEAAELLEASPMRIEPKCPLFFVCGGCALMHMSYEAQLAAKKAVIENAMRRIGGFRDFKINEMLGMDKPERYRNKMVFHAAEQDGKTVFGFYAPKTHRVIPLGDCLTGDVRNNKIIAAVTGYMEEAGLKPYDERTHKGAVRMLFTRVSRVSGNMMAVLSVNGNRLPKPELLVEKLRMAVPELQSIILNVNTAKRSHGLGTKNITLYGADYIEDEISGISFKISPNSFFQVNPVMTEQLYGKAMEYADLDETDTVMDIYCGIGTISLLAAKRAKRVTGVEAVEKAIEDARDNAAANGIENAEFYAANAEDIVPKLIKHGERPNVVILDPPRKGSDTKMLEAVLAAAPERIVYVSCNPATLARDTKMLCSGGYKITRTAGCDMFPDTCHVETVCQLVLRTSQVHINIDVDVEELVQDKRGQATYEQIKDYVLKHNGLKVSSLYIAQIKRKCGIIERENYNKPKSEDAKQPQCSPEKEAAIMEALKHFHMV